MQRLLTLLAALSLTACALFAPSSPPLEDGQIPLPVDYKTWPKFLSEVQRPDAKQVREIYVNPTGYSTKAGQPFAHGSQFVMENYAAQVDANGDLKKTAEGKLIKGDLLRLFVMAKGKGYGATTPSPLKTGDWVFTSYDAKGIKTADALVGCRGCHIPLGDKDFVARYDEFFATRK